MRNTLDEDNVSYRAGLDWAPANGLLFYGNVSRGYKAGSFPLVSATSDIQFEPATQEELIAYELGAKLTLFDRSLQLNGAVFHYDYTDKQVRGRTPPLPPFGAIEKLVNVPESTIDGAELQLMWRPMEGLTFNGGITYLDSEVQGSFIDYTPAGAAQDFGGEPLPLTPEVQAVASVDYEWGLTENLGAFVGASATYRSETNATFGEDPVYGIDGYTLLDLRAGVETNDGRWRLSLWGRNVTDEYYWSNVFRGTDTIVRFTGMPATYGVTLSFRN